MFLPISVTVQSLKISVGPRDVLSIQAVSSSRRMSVPLSVRICGFFVWPCGTGAKSLARYRKKTGE